ncbi:MAG: phosphoenolpyruvate--protein phosphotransferase [Vicinamibacterales bacterium]
MTKFDGLGVSPGVAAGAVLVLRQDALDSRFRVPPESSEAELFRLSRARAHAVRQLQEIKERVRERVGADQSDVFDAQLLMLDDPMLIERAASLIDREQMNAEWALECASTELTAVLQQADDPYLRERQGDIHDVVGRLRHNLRGARAGVSEMLASVRGPAILVADDLPPSVAAQIDWDVVVGFVTKRGSWTHHSAILARSLRVPAIMGVRQLQQLAPGRPVLIDGATGEGWLDPDPTFVAARQSRPTRIQPRPVRSPATTRDGERVSLFVNLDRPTDEAVAMATMAVSGVGLYRSEFLAAETGPADPSESEQVAAYGSVVSRFAPREVTIRTFDREPVADFADGGADARAEAPRGIRGSLRDGAASLRVQLRSLLRVAPQGSLRVMLPFVSGVDEVRSARRVLDEVRAELRAEGLTVPVVPLGVMIEVPAAVAIVDLLAREVDFFSIGTNDLVQFALAADRGRADSGADETWHPGILRMVRRVVRVARASGRRVSVCGEMASRPEQLAMLIGLGIREISVSPSALGECVAVLEELHVADAQRLARRALSRATASEVRELVADHWSMLGHSSPA